MNPCASFLTSRFSRPISSAKLEYAGTARFHGHLLGKDIDTSVVTYTGDGILEEASNLVLYQNIFQENMFFVREYEDISQRLSDDKQEEFNQEYRVQPLRDEEISIVLGDEFRNKKLELMADKAKSKK